MRRLATGVARASARRAQLGPLSTSVDASKSDAADAASAPTATDEAAALLWLMRERERALGAAAPSPPDGASGVARGEARVAAAAMPPTALPPTLTAATAAAVSAASSSF